MSSTANPHHLPSVDVMLRHPKLGPLRESLTHSLLVELIRAELDATRGRLRSQAGDQASRGASQEAVAQGVLERAAAVRRPTLRHVINATGVVLHTNLGRAPLSEAAMRAMTEAAAYSNLEYDLESGQRGSRHSHLEALLCQVTGAEAALAVNNNASAMLLALAECATGREVVVSRGQAVEIGGGFRIPDVLRQSGARLVEVGTTNRTRLADYAAAIGPETAALLHVHASNFRVVGFTESVSPAQMAELAHARNILLLDDVGSGCLLDTTAFGIPASLREPMVQESVQAGSDVVCFSGDKLLGGPQAGIIAGKAEVIARLKRHPLTRALRLDKAAIAGLEATLLHYRLGEAAQAVPVWRMIGTPLEELRRRAESWQATLQAAGVRCDVLADESAIGGGSLPAVTLPTFVLALSPESVGTEDAAARLRRGEPPVIGRIAGDRLLLDPRTVLPGEEPALLQRLERLFSD